MTAADALRRLKETGTLSALPRPATALSEADIGSDVAKATDRMLRASLRHGAQRWIAPGVNLTVLP